MLKSYPNHNTSVDWLQFDEAVETMRVSLRDLGLCRGDFLPILARGGIALFSVVEACFQEGIIVVPLSPNVPSLKLEEVLRQTGAQTLICEDSRNDIRGTSQLFMGMRCFRLPAATVKLTEASGLQKTALVMFTSGTTGTPKGICFSLENIRFVVSTLLETFALKQSDKILNPVPASFDYGLFHFFLARKSGASLVTCEGMHMPRQLIALCRAENPTFLPLMPSVLNLFKLTDKGYDESLIFSSDLSVSTTGEPLLEDHVAALKKYFPKASVYSMYGLTECKRVSCLKPNELKEKWPSVGLPLEGTRVRALDDEGTPLGAGRQGRIEVTGPNVTLGYLTDGDGKDCSFHDNGPSRTLVGNDVISLDADGYIYVHGRKDDIVKISGRRASLNEIKNALQSHPGVASVRVVALECEGEVKVIASVVPQPEKDITETTLKKHVFEVTGEAHLIPKEISFDDDINLSENMKII